MRILDFINQYTSFISSNCSNSFSENPTSQCFKAFSFQSFVSYHIPPIQFLFFFFLYMIYKKLIQQNSLLLIAFISSSLKTKILNFCHHKGHIDPCMKWHILSNFTRPNILTRKTMFGISNRDNFIFKGIPTALCSPSATIFNNSWKLNQICKVFCNLADNAPVRFMQLLPRNKSMETLQLVMPL